MKEMYKKIINEHRTIPISNEEEDKFDKNMLVFPLGFLELDKILNEAQKELLKELKNRGFINDTCLRIIEEDLK